MESICALFQTIQKLQASQCLAVGQSVSTWQTSENYMSIYMSGLLVGFVLSSSSESSLMVSTDSPFNTWETNYLRDVLRMRNVLLLLVGSTLSWVHAVLCQLGGCYVLSHLVGRAVASTSRGCRLHPQP